MYMKRIMLMCLWTQICLCIFLFWHTALAQQSPPPSQAPAGVQVAQDSSSLLEYAKFLREEEKAHREYLEKLYTTTTIVLGVLVTIGIGLVSFFQIKTKKDVREAVDAAFRETVGEEVQNRMEQFRKNIVHIEEGQQSLKSDTNAIRVALKGIVTKYEHEYLRRLADPQPFPSEVSLPDTFARHFAISS